MDKFSFRQLFGLLFSVFAVVLVSSVVLAWTGPTEAPTGGNVSAPINVGTVDQVKNAGLGVNSLAVFGNSLLQASSYINFGTTSGSSGYGIRDNSGTIETKSSGGAWASINSTIQSYLTANNYHSGTPAIACTTASASRSNNNDHSVACPGGYIATGGGGTCTEANTMRKSYPISGTGWGIYYNESCSTVTVYAICCKIN
ncbi:MAG: hypothetical protein NUV59_04380 [Patescibacteria group bacterium]|nr:hypothetical protein [Patescibacteria group bacterium]